MATLFEQIQEFNKKAVEYSKAIDSVKYVNINDANDVFTTFEEALQRKLNLADYVQINSKNQLLGQMAKMLFGDATNISLTFMKDIKDFHNNVELIEGKGTKKRVTKRKTQPKDPNYIKELSRINSELVAERKKDSKSQWVKDLLYQRSELQKKYNIKSRPARK